MRREASRRQDVDFTLAIFSSRVFRASTLKANMQYWFSVAVGLIIYCYLFIAPILARLREMIAEQQRTNALLKTMLDDFRLKAVNDGQFSERKDALLVAIEKNTARARESS